MSNVDPFDAVLDARSEQRYEDERGEPTLEEIKTAYYYECSSDESAGQADKFVGGKR